MDSSNQLLIDDAEQSIAVSADLLQQIDENLGGEYKSREEFVKAAIRHYLAKLQKPRTSVEKTEEFPEIK